MKLGALVEAIDRSKLPATLTYPSASHDWVATVGGLKWIDIRRADEVGKASDLTLLSRDELNRDDWQITYTGWLQ